MLQCHYLFYHIPSDEFQVPVRPAAPRTATFIVFDRAIDVTLKFLTSASLQIIGNLRNRDIRW